MTTIELLLSQVAISLLVVGVYHAWRSGGKQAAPPVAAPIAPPTPPPLVEKVAVAPVAAAQPKSQPAPEATTPEILAVIAAAISVVLGEQYKVVAVQPSAAPMPELNVWALEGRLDQFQSHRVR